MSEGKKEEVFDAWKRLVCDRQEDVDPCGEYHWESMFVGFALAMGCPPEEATDKRFYDVAYEIE